MQLPIRLQKSPKTAQIRQGWFSFELFLNLFIWFNVLTYLRLPGVFPNILTIDYMDKETSPSMV